MTNRQKSRQSVRQNYSATDSRNTEMGAANDEKTAATIDKAIAQHVLISYARRDGSEHARRLDIILAKRGIKTWFDKRDIDPFQDFTAEIEKAIKEASCVIVCVTADVIRGDSFVRREIAFAQVAKKPVIVARFADLTPPVSIINYMWIDFFCGWEKAVRELLASLRRALCKYAPPPAV